MLNSKSVGNKIALARKKLNLSQAELAQQVAISSQAVGKWERGESMPDITTLNRLAEIMGVDLNYFSDSFQSVDLEARSLESISNEAVEPPSSNRRKKLSWNMSESNWLNVDFSGLKNLQEKFSSSNVQNCKFIGSDLSGLLLRNNNFDACDFSKSKIVSSQIQKSNFYNVLFNSCLLHETEFSFSFINGCDFTDADFTGVVIKLGGFEKNTIANAVFNSTSFIDTNIRDIVFEGTVEDCCFEKCTFSKVTFQNSKLINTFFKYNDLKRVQFINCQADRMTYELLKNGKANLTGLTVID
jgi:uncharacterized protein YjbI with pentapeptide repeats